MLADLAGIRRPPSSSGRARFRRLRRAAFVRAAASGAAPQRLSSGVVPMLADGPPGPVPGAPWPVARAGGLKDQLGLGSVRLALSFGDGLAVGDRAVP